MLQLYRVLLTSVVSISITLSGSLLANPLLKEQFKRPDTIPFPADNPYSVQKAALGKMLFFDPRLSNNRNMTCATCHNPSFGWEDATARSVGDQNTQLDRHSPSIINAAWGDRYFWDGRAASLEEQAKGPIESAVEMNLPLPEAVARLSQVPQYRTWFGRVFGSEGITADTIAKAIATFERTIVSGEAPFDRWVNGDESAISPAAKRGFDLFVGKAKCVDCHSGWNFTDMQFHDIGLPGNDLGRGQLTGNAQENFAFKTPSLRNIGQRAPYMHDGRFENLTGVIGHYIPGGVKRPTLSTKMVPIALSAQDINDLEAFMLTLTGEDTAVSLPTLPY
ncbi:tryptophan tryptophylquinone biosynthesis enzyme MauG [Thalassotalea euphylliae]|uniref:Methylamine utilization protein MauG n=1 Tax=Thalassotalea euphylliae TaxID=1655234 RepID=A0A3E0TZM4_9GAMM|nr:tryptophan tryptophylquinone biosynthesis enzyme MauG [Thalassotalea euphylliae]